MPATRKLLAQLHIGIDDIDIIELNEAFAAQAHCRAPGSRPAGGCVNI